MPFYCRQITHQNIKNSHSCSLTTAVQTSAALCLHLLDKLAVDVCAPIAYAAHIPDAAHRAVAAAHAAHFAHTMHVPRVPRRCAQGVRRLGRDPRVILPAAAQVRQHPLKARARVREHVGGLASWCAARCVLRNVPWLLLCSMTQIG